MGRSKLIKPSLSVVWVIATFVIADGRWEQVRTRGRWNVPAASFIFHAHCYFSATASPPLLFFAPCVPAVRWLKWCRRLAKRVLDTIVAFVCRICVTLVRRPENAFAFPAHVVGIAKCDRGCVDLGPEDLFFFPRHSLRRLIWERITCIRGCQINNLLIERNNDRRRG